MILEDRHHAIVYLEGGGANVLRIPLSVSDVENGAAGRVTQIARQLRNLHWISAESSAGIDANLAGALADRETLLSLRLEEAGRSGGRFRQRLLWRNIRRGTGRNPEPPILTRLDYGFG